MCALLEIPFLMQVLRTLLLEQRIMCTSVQGLKKEFSYNKILKKEFCCNGTVVQDPELGQVIQLQGDQRKNVSTVLVQLRLNSLCMSVPMDKKMLIAIQKRLFEELNSCKTDSPRQ
ncbi:hypothetical protein V2J09_009478 [Rumex salicifolius]